ncbi:MAG: nucleotidyltransferase domain-containing protein [Candidatus Aminicenantia bacterium]
MVKKSNKVIKIINKYIRIISKDISVERVILFGSYVRGDYDRESDIDLAVISPDFSKKDYLENIQYLYRIGSDMEEIIEALPYTSEEYENADPRSFLGEIKRTGKIVYQKE